MKAGPIKEYDIAKTQFFKGHAVISGFFSYNMIDLFFSVKKKIIKETKLEERKKIILSFLFLSVFTQCCVTVSSSQKSDTKILGKYLNQVKDDKKALKKFR